VVSTPEQLFGESAAATLFAVFWIGALASLGPCVIVRLPVIAGYVGGSTGPRRRAVLLTALFALGLLIASLALGAMSLFVGDFLRKIPLLNRYIYWLAGILLLIAGIRVSGLVSADLWPERLQRFGQRLSKAGNGGALLLGLALGMIVMPACPTCGAGLFVLAGIAISRELSQSHSLALFAAYGLGQCLPVVAAGVLTGLLRVGMIRWLRNLMCSIEERIQLLAGNTLMVLGLYFLVVG
jgi:cytochrome c biogenesis protein CcdA